MIQIIMDSRTSGYVVTSNNTGRVLVAESCDHQRLTEIIKLMPQEHQAVVTVDSESTLKQLAAILRETQIYVEQKQFVEDLDVAAHIQQLASATPTKSHAKSRHLFFVFGFFLLGSILGLLAGIPVGNSYLEGRQRVIDTRQSAVDKMLSNVDSRIDLEQTVSSLLHHYEPDSIILIEVLEGNFKCVFVAKKSGLRTQAISNITDARLLEGAASSDDSGVFYFYTLTGTYK